MQILVRQPPPPSKPDRSRPLLIQRLERLDALRRFPRAQAIELELCRRSAEHWFDWWAWTYDPRRTLEIGASGKPLSALTSFDLFARQRQLLSFLEMRMRHRDDGLVEKSRDMGWTWESGGWCLHKWRFAPGFKIGYGSYLDKYVDKLGDPDAFFERLRMLLRNLPTWMLPRGFGDAHDNHERLINPDNANTIIGAVGKNMGRGGRVSVFIIDEASHLEQGDAVDASTAATSDVRIWASSVNGMGNIFSRKRWGGSLRPDQIFVLDYRDNPLMTPERVKKQKAKMEPHNWAAEYERDYSASVEGICIPAKWVQSCHELGDLLRTEQARDPISTVFYYAEPEATGIAGFDVGAGKAKSVYIARFGAVVTLPQVWGSPDTVEVAHQALEACVNETPQRRDGARCRVTTMCYDSVGVGHNVQYALKNTPKSGIRIEPVNVGVPPSQRMWPDGKTSEEKFANLKAELWWTCRARCKASHEFLLYLRGEEGGVKHSVSDCLILPNPAAGPDAQILLAQISLPKVLRNERGKLIMESKAQLAARELPSPDHAEALMLSLTPVPEPVTIPAAALARSALPPRRR